MDNDRGQISEQIFEPSGEYCLQMKVDPRSYERNFMQLRKESRTSTGLNPWPRDTGAML